MTVDRVKFLYLSFGSIEIYNQCILSALSCLAHNKLSTIVIVTDNPDYFESFVKEFECIEYLVITQKDIEKMRGEIDFVHRIKIAAIELVTNHFKNCDAYVYLDCDTFFKTNISPVVSQLSTSVSITHKHEFYFPDYKYSEESNSTFQLLDHIRKNLISYKRGKDIVIVNERFSSWNAGVLGLHNSYLYILKEVFDLTDAFYRKVPHHAAEQFAFSYVLQCNTRILVCENEIEHYWYRVKKKIVGAFLKKNINESWNNLRIDQKLELIKQWTNYLPIYLENHVWLLRDHAIQAFNTNDLVCAYKHTIKALLKDPFDFKFIKDVLYHSKRIFIEKIKFYK